MRSNFPFDAHQQLEMADNESDEDDATTHRRRGTARDLQKTQLEKLMANPDKPVHIPEAPRSWKPKDAPEFVRFYMGSSAGAGSEVYHVYRHLRRRENIRQQWIQEEAEQEQMEDEFQMKLAANRQADQERTEKKRAKRLKKKQRKKEKKEAVKDTKTSASTSDEAPPPPTEPHDSSGEEEEGEKEEPHFVIGGR